MMRFALLLDWRLALSASPLGRPQTKSYMPSSFGFAFSTTLAAEHIVEIPFAHEDSKLVLCHPNSKKVVEQKPVALLVHHQTLLMTLSVPERNLASGSHELPLIVQNYD